MDKKQILSVPIRGRFVLCTMLVIVVLSFTVFTFAEDQAPRRAPTEEEREHDLYGEWSKKYQHFIDIHKIDEEWEASNPYAPFDLLRMYRESDLIIRCDLNNYVGEGLGNFMLIARIETIYTIYKGDINMVDVNATNPNQYNINVMYDQAHTGDMGYCRLGQGKKHEQYILFLEKCPPEELKARGYDKEPGTFYKVNRVWHGAIRMTGKCQQGGEANYYLRRSPEFKYLDNFRQDFAAALADIWALESANPSPSMIARVRQEAAVLAEFHKALQENPDGKEVPKALEAMPVSVLETTKGYEVWKQYRATENKDEKETLKRHLDFLWALYNVGSISDALGIEPAPETDRAPENVPAPPSSDNNNASEGTTVPEPAAPRDGDSVPLPSEASVPLTAATNTGFPWYASGIIGLALGGAATFVLTRKK